MKKKNIIIPIMLIIMSLLYIFIVKNVDLKPIGPNESMVGLSTINSWFKNLVGVNMNLYKVTEFIGLFPILIVLVYGLLGLAQLIKRKSLFKVDKELYGLLGVYVIILMIYVVFEKFPVNFRPVLIDGELKASFPSSHTLLGIVVCISSIMINKIKYNNTTTNKMNVFSFIVMILLVLGRTISGYHWISDIIGSLIMSSPILYSFYLYLSDLKVKNN